VSPFSATSIEIVVTRFVAAAAIFVVVGAPAHTSRVVLLSTNLTSASYSLSSGLHDRLQATFMSLLRQLAGQAGRSNVSPVLAADMIMRYLLETWRSASPPPLPHASGFSAAACQRPNLSLSISSEGARKEKHAHRGHTHEHTHGGLYY